jgi:molybdenum cofactor cytidylyltransferase
MFFGPVPIEEAEGGIVVHSVRFPDGGVKKGTVVGPQDIARLGAAGIESIVVARLEPGDVPEDEAALRLARAAAGPGVRVEAPFTGRSNLYAEAAGVLCIDGMVVDCLNAVDEAVTLATLPPFKAVEQGEMIGTVKIIPFAVPRSVLGNAESVLRDSPTSVLSVAPFRPLKVGVVSTLLPGLKASVVRKTVSALADRLAPAGATVVSEREVPHDAALLRDALADLVGPDVDLLVVFGASAITDRRDVIPAAIEAGGGRIEHFGMPVDPGNLLLIGSLEGKPVLGAPGCARSPKENGFDWVLQRLLAGLPVTRADIVGMGVGGLLMEIVQRGQLREPGASGEHE